MLHTDIYTGQYKRIYVGIVMETQQIVFVTSIATMPNIQDIFLRHHFAERPDLPTRVNKLHFMIPTLVNHYLQHLGRIEP
jgi:hypothetical protein